MSLALLALSLLCARPAQAQISVGPVQAQPLPGQPLPDQPVSIDPGHYWRIDKLLKGSSFSYDVLDVPYDGKKAPSDAGDGIIEGEDIVNASASLTYTTTLKWIPAAGKDNTSDPPPSIVYIDEFSQAEESPGIWNGPGAAASGAGTADDGLGDPPLPWKLGCISSATLLLRKDGSSGTIKLDDVTVSAEIPTSTWQQYSNYPGHYYWDWTGAEVELSFDVTLDPNQHAQSVTITSSIDPTYHKDPVTGKQQNVAAADGTMTADSVNIRPQPAPDPFPHITYYGNPVGSWGPNSSYHWYDSIMGNSDANTFAVPPFPIEYLASLHSQEHINLHCIDPSNGLSASGNYYVQFHDEWEPSSWPPDGAPYKVMEPDAEMPSWPTYSWKMVTPVSGLNWPNLSFLVGYQEAGIESVDGGLELGIDPVKVHFGVSGNPKDKMPVSQTLTPSPPLALGQETWAVYREIVNRTKGHLDHYNEHGYSGPGIWRHDIMVGIDLNYYSPYPTTNTAPSDPPDGWNPPGYN